MQRNKFPQRERIKTQDHFKQIYSNARKLDHAWWRLYITKTTNKKGKVAFIASKKCGKAVIRNKLKRVLREIIRHMANELSDYDIIIIAKHRLANITYSRARVGLRRQLEENQFIRKKTQ